MSTPSQVRYFSCGNQPIHGSPSLPGTDQSIISEKFGPTVLSYIGAASAWLSPLTSDSFLVASATPD
jgi:hypothetical protein